MPLQQLTGGNLLIAGFSRPTVSGNQMDAWIMKLDAAGDLVWSCTYGDSNTDEALAIEQASDGSIIVAGNTHAITNGNQDGWLLKLDGDTGNPIWQVAVTGGAEDAFSTIREVSPGSYMAAGHTSSYGAGGQDAWIVSLNSDGSPAWLKAYGGTGDDRVATLETTLEGNLILAGTTDSFGDGSEDSWVFRIDNSGDLLDQGAIITEITDPAVFQSTSIPAIANSITAVDTLFTATDITQDVIVTTSSLIPTSNGGP
jgi:outer membrane protein assembly factor BamB